MTEISFKWLCQKLGNHSLQVGGQETAKISRYFIPQREISRLMVYVFGIHSNLAI